MEDAFEEFKGWYMTRPFFTRTYLSVCVGITLLVSLRVVAPQILAYTFRTGIMKLQLWRPFTALVFMGKFDFSFLFNIYFAYIAVNKVETQIFSRQRYDDFLWLVVMLMAGCTIVGSIFDLYFFTDVFLMALIYIWCKRQPHEEIRILFGLVVKSKDILNAAGYFPFVYAIMMTLFGGSLIHYILGIILGHAYIFAKDIAVLRYHKDYLATPRWFSNWYFGRQQDNRPRGAAGGGIFQGQGVRLG